MTPVCIFPEKQQQQRQRQKSAGDRNLEKTESFRTIPKTTEQKQKQTNKRVKDKKKTNGKSSRLSGFRAAAPCIDGLESSSP
jgi:hypothetical protein